MIYCTNERGQPVPCTICDEDRRQGMRRDLLSMAENVPMKLAGILFPNLPAGLLFQRECRAFATELEERR